MPICLGVDWTMIGAVVLALAGILLGMLEDIDRIRAEADERQ